MASVHDYPSQPWGGVPFDPTLPYRVARLEEDMRDLKATLKAIEGRLLSIETALAEIKGHIAAVDGRITGIEGRLQSVPTIWQMITMFTGFLFGIAAIIFATANFVTP